MISTQTHDYDGTLGPLWEAAKKQAIDKGWRSLPLTEALHKAQGMVGANVSALKALGLLASDTDNFDSKSSLDAQVLFQWLMGVPDLDKDLLTDVMAEIVDKGSCSQGRTTRILQLFQSLLCDPFDSFDSTL
jgi:hypothetical protein